MLVEIRAMLLAVSSFCLHGELNETYSSTRTLATQNRMPGHRVVEKSMVFDAVSD